MGIETEALEDNVLVGDDSKRVRHYLQNIGVKRIAGANLLEKGIAPKWLYYIEDIACTAVYLDADTGFTWIGSYGQAVAGNNATRDALVPFEGQRYYSTEDDTAYEYTNGAWGSIPNGAALPKINAPKYVVITSSSELVLGRSYVVNASGVSLSLPSTPENGHSLEIVANFTSTITSSVTYAAELYGSGEPNGQLQLSVGAIYYFVYTSSGWVAYSTVLPTAYISNIVDFVEQAVENAEQFAEDAETQALLASQYTANINQAVIDSEYWADVSQQAAQALTGGMFFGGTWDASTGNAPPVPSEGSVTYRINVSGTIDGKSYTQGDDIFWNNIDNVWVKVDNTDRVFSFNGQVGDITYTPSWGEITGKPDLATSAQLEEVELLALAGL